MKKIITVMLVAISVLLLGNVFYTNHKVVNTKKDVREVEQVQPVGIYNGYMWISKYDEEGNELPNVRFELKSRNEQLSVSSVYDYYGYYINETLRGENYFSDVYNNLTNEQKALVESIHTIDDLDNMPEDSVQCSSYDRFTQYEFADSFSVPAVGAGENIPEVGYCYVEFPTYLTLEEVRAPSGYAKDKVLIPGVITIGFHQVGYEEVSVSEEVSIPPVGAQELTNKLEMMGAMLYSGNPYYMIRYGDVDRNSLLGIDIDSAARIWSRNYSETECIRQERKSKLPENKIANIFASQGQAAAPSMASRVFRDTDSASICLVNHRGDVSLEATSTVNNVESITTSVNQQLEYKVVVKNTGEVDALDNKIRSTIPEGFVYVDGTASLGGVYNNGAIEWEVDRINKGENLELTFKAYAPKGVNVGQDYIGTTSVDSFDSNKKVEANKTMVRLSLQNPKTGVPMYIFVLILMVAFAVSLVTVQQYLNGKKQGQQ